MVAAGGVGFATPPQTGYVLSIRVSINTSQNPRSNTITLWRNGSRTVIELLGRGQADAVGSSRTRVGFSVPMKTRLRCNAGAKEQLRTSQTSFKMSRNTHSGTLARSCNCTTEASKDRPVEGWIASGLPGVARELANPAPGASGTLSVLFVRQGPARRGDEASRTGKSPPSIWHVCVHPTPG